MSMRSRLFVAAILAVLWGSAAHAALTPAEGSCTLPNFRFDSGETLPELRLHYTTLGSPVRDEAGVVRNAVMILHGTSGDGTGFLREQFAGQLFGPGQLLDASKYFVILPDNLGHGKSSRPSDGLHMRFPKYHYEDMVRAQHEMLTQCLKVNHLRLVMGTSMGGMHTWVWGYTYPDFMDALMPLASLPVEIAGRNRMLRKMAIDSITGDPEWKQGDYKTQPRGLNGAVHVMIFMTSSPLQWQKEAPTREKAEAFLDAQMKRWTSTLDANDLIYQLDASRDYNPLPHLGEIRAPLYAINSADDQVNPPELGILDEDIHKVARGRYILLPITSETRGHGTHSLPAIWGKYLADLLSASEPSQPPKTASDETAVRVRKLADEVFAAGIEHFPEGATSSGMTDGPHDRVTDNSLEALARWQAREDAWLAALRQIDGASLAGRPEWALYGVLREQLESAVAKRVCRSELWDVDSYQEGWQARYTDLARLQPVGSAKARAAALARLHALPAAVDTDIANLHRGVALGYTAPKAVVRAVVKQIDGLLATPVASSPFASPAQRDREPAFRAEYLRRIKQELYPAMRRYRSYLAGAYLKSAREELGVAMNPHGVECYRAALRSVATVDRSPYDVYNLGVREMERIESEMKAIAEHDFATSDVRGLLARLGSDPQYTFKSGDEMIALAKERPGAHPLLRYSYNSGFGEGWALYAEQLADEMGFYSSPVARMGMLQSDAFRAAQLVIDSGIHTKGWTRQQAVEYLRSHTTKSPAVVEGEVDRYISWPGQASSYMIGKLEILRLREEAKKALGARFDLKMFHEKVLENGAVTLPMLAESIQRWIGSAG